MAPLPESNTARLFVDYNDGQNDHTLIARYAPSAGSDIAMDNVGLFFQALDPILYLVTIVGARVAATGSNISVPIPWTGSPTFGSTSMPIVNAPRQMTFLGRTIGGRRVRWSVFGFKGTFPDLYRYAATALGEIGDAIDAINDGLGAGVFIAIDGFNPSVYPYADFNFNSYWEGETRG